ncbi:hypothetical protein [Streptomyces sp. MH60]|uniref:hypothetical protein n=1 Tax=Streptomyces sp. MH60 TaxID=1940758 RepID=UPI000D4AA626|nr:hypothetical protein [Streptomyces sp. MH60]PPS86461.1 hypothetical protein BZZ08_03428 [Streptomyces sp. MH60]
MKTRITFTGILEFDGETDRDPEEAVDIALLRGDKHADYTLFHTGPIRAEHVGDDE